MAQIRIHGYTDRLNAKAGQALTAHVSAEGTTEVQAQLVRLIHGDEHPDGPGFIEREVDSPVNRAWPVQRRYVQQGNFLTVDDPQGRLDLSQGAFTLYAFVFATLPTAGRQVILGRWDLSAQRGVALGLTAQGHVELWVGDGTQVDAVQAELPLPAQVWHFVAASFDPATAQASVHQVPVLNRYNSLWGHVVPLRSESHVQMSLRVRPARCDGGFLVAGAHEHNAARGAFVAQCFNGKIDRPGVLGHAADRATLEALARGEAPPRDAVRAAWDTSEGYTDRGIGDRVVDTGPHGLHAMGFNRPVRAQTGWNWSGRDDCFRLNPRQYGAIEFHDDALTDCRWPASFEIPLPADLKSGCYAVRLRSGQGSEASEEYLPFFVRPQRPTAPICLLMPTASYLAYGNAQLAFEAPFAQAICAVVPVFTEREIDYQKNGLEFGLSTYDHHRNGAGVCHTSARRPLINMRPKCRMPGVAWPWQFPADLSIVAWLEHQGYEYDVLTDHDLHAEGLAAIEPYRVVINGTHAEYYSERMLDATEDYLARGGRVMYLSGNGYYWVVGWREDEPWLMEVRKLEAGSRAWQARPGEHYLASTGERSGLWRHRGRAPQKIVGTGFASEGMDESVPYRRMPDSWHKGVAWIFDGVEGDVIGDFGLAGGGAAGVEIDRYDLTLGTPPHARILASSEGFSDNYPLVQEEIMYNHPGMGGTQHPGVRCDMVYFTTPMHGAVFAPSSIAWGQALPCKGFDNNVSRVMKNVVDAFIRPGPLPGGEFIGEEKLWR
ncbi:MAG: LamG domain-containing protein [Rubrivivax sp.]|nr:LamG domain-containing protein [Rubrivivax sp.]